jgi:hypothetical protein
MAFLCLPPSAEKEAISVRHRQRRLSGRPHADQVVAGYRLLTTTIITCAPKRDNAARWASFTHPQVRLPFQLGYAA